jgi:hypothetical protein
VLQVSADQLALVLCQELLPGIQYRHCLAPIRVPIRLRYYTVYITLCQVFKITARSPIILS